MPIIKSAIRRVRVAERKRKVNLIKIRKYKELIKEFETLMAKGKTAEAKKLFPEVQKAIDLAAKKNIIHPKNAARKKSRLAKVLDGKLSPKITVKPKQGRAKAKTEKAAVPKAPEKKEESKPEEEKAE